MTKLVWQRLGFVRYPQHSIDWARHSLLQPTPLLLSGEVIRVFVGMRDAEGHSRVGWLDLSVADPTQVLDVSRTPALDLGSPGCFDELGVVPCALLRRGGQLHLYYAGYQAREGVRFLAYSGLASSSDDGRTFTRVKTSPVLPPTAQEPLFRAIHSILPCDTGGWMVWYGAGSSFRQGANKTLPVYDIRQMRTSDGETFPDYGPVVVPLRGAEHRVGRPCVIRWREGYLMFYGYGTEVEPYRLGLARSADGTTWIRCDDAMIIDGPDECWDRGMQAYPAVLQTERDTLLFYNGNAYGREGFGVCRLKR